MNTLKIRLESIITTLLMFSACLLLASCASYSGSGLKPGDATLADVEGVMGKAAMRWQNADGSIQLAFPRGPAGFHTYMAMIGPDGRLQSLNNVLNMKNFARVQQGMNEEQVLRILGPTTCAKAYFAARDELVWNWRYLDDFRASAHFFVLFDKSKGTVRSTMSMASEVECS